MEKIVEYIQQSPKAHFMIHGRIPVYFKNGLTKKINMDSVCRRVGNILPAFLFKNISAVSIGQYDTLDDRAVDSVYDKKIIYLTNIQDDEEDIIENIIHEVAHSLEELYSEQIYGDGLLKKEFLRKRKQLYNELSQKYSIDDKYFRKTEYSKSLDQFFYKKVGYDTLSYFTEPLFVTPYSATSLREYFSDGFERYYLGDQNLIEDICPVLYNKIKLLEETAGK
jgi:hypothetical protein